MKRAISKHLRDFLAILFIMVLALGVAGFVLSNQRFYLPAWVPVVGTDFYDLKVELQTAQSVVPGQGQTVNIAGVKIGEISKVELEDGQAVVDVKIKKKYSPVYKDASILLRPKTPLKDMFLELDPGNPSAGEIEDGGRLTSSNTLPDVGADEVLAQLDSDTLTYLRVLLNSGSEALEGDNPAALREVFKRLEPTARDTAKITGQLSKRRRNLKNVIHNFQELSTELGSKDKQLAALVDSANANFEAIAHQEGNLRESLRLLPGTLTQTRDTLRTVDQAASNLGPALQKLRPGARALGPAQRQVQPFARETTPIIRDELRPFARDVRPAVRDTRAAAEDLQVAAPRADALAQGAELARQHARVQPARGRGGLPVLERVAQPRGRDHLQLAGRSRAGSAWPRDAQLPDVGHPAQRAEGHPTAGPLDPAAEPARSHEGLRRDSLEMVKEAPSAGRMIAMVAFALSCVGILLYLWLVFGGSIPLRPEGYRFNVKFPEATQLAQEADVRISGVTVGKVKTKEPDESTGLTETEIEIDEKYAPLRTDTKAILRQKSLLGETYVELSPGRGSKMLDDGGRLPEGQVSPTVEIDEIFRGFPPKTRRAFSTWLSEQGRAVNEGGESLNNALAVLTPFAQDVGDVLKVLDEQEAATRGLVRDTGVVFDALSARQGQLRSLVSNANRVFTTTAARNRELADTFVAFPTFLRETGRPRVASRSSRRTPIL